MPHATATFNGKIIADTDKWELIEGNIYFPPDSVDKSVFSSSASNSYCPWKGTASYYNVNVNGKEAKDAAWFYSQPITAKAEPIKDYFAFYKSKIDVKSEGQM